MKNDSIKYLAMSITAMAITMTALWVAGSLNPFHVVNVPAACAYAWFYGAVLLPTTEVKHE